MAQAAARGPSGQGPWGELACAARALGTACLSRTSFHNCWSFPPALVSLCIYVCLSLTFLFPLVLLPLMMPFAFEFLFSLPASQLLSHLPRPLFPLLPHLSLPGISLFLSLLPSLAPALCFFLCRARLAPRRPQHPP